MRNWRRETSPRILVEFCGITTQLSKYRTVSASVALQVGVFPQWVFALVRVSHLTLQWRCKNLFTTRSKCQLQYYLFQQVKFTLLPACFYIVLCICSSMIYKAYRDGKDKKKGTATCFIEIVLIKQRLVGTYFIYDIYIEYNSNPIANSAFWFWSKDWI